MVTNAGTDTAITLKVDGVNLDHFTVNSVDPQGTANFGVDIKSSRNSLVEINVNNFYYGIYIEGQVGNNIVECTGSGNIIGIYLVGDSHDNNIGLCTFTNGYSTSSGVEIGNSQNSNHNTITDSFVSGMSYGIVVGNQEPGTTTDNLVEKNTVINNGIGIMVWGETSTIDSNTITDNTNGVMIFSPGKNNVIYNNFFNQVNNVNPGGTANNWNTAKTEGTNILGGSSLGGNYWAEPDGTGFSQQCTDANKDGFCDSAYTIGSGSIDNFPLKPVNPPACGNVILDSSTPLQLEITQTMDIDTGTVSGGGDIWWERITSTTRQMVPYRGATIVNLGIMDDSAFTAITAAQLAQYVYSTTPIRGDDSALNQLGIDDVFAVKTDLGNYAKVQVKDRSQSPTNDIGLHVVVYSCEGATGSLHVDSDPEGAPFYFTRVGQLPPGTTPAYYTGLPDDVYEVRIELPGYYWQYGEATITGGSSETIMATLVYGGDFNTAPDPANPLKIQFNEVGTGSPSQRHWDFGDGGSSTSANPVHTYASPGDYTVQLVVYNNDDPEHWATITKVITVTSISKVDLYPFLLKSDPINLPDGKLPPETTMYASVDPVAADTRVDQWGKENARMYTSPPKESYLFVFDPTPKKNWEHEVIYYFVKTDGTVDGPHIAYTPPEGIPISYYDGVRPPSSGEGTSSLKVSGTGTNSVGTTGTSGGLTVTASASSATCDTSQLNCDHCWALLVSGGYDPDNNNARYYQDMSSMYQTLLKPPYCYPENHIYVLMSDGIDPTPDQITDSGNYVNSDPTLGQSNGNQPEHYLAATRSNLDDTLTKSLSSLTGNDQLFVFVTNHGGLDPGGSGKVRLWLWKGDYIWADQFVSELPTNTKALVMTMEQCYSGGFVDPFIPQGYPGPQDTQKRVIATAASAIEPSNLNYFSYYWIQGVGGPANTDTDNLVQMKEAFDYSTKNDPSAQTSDPNLKETPQYRDSNAAGLSLALSSCSRCQYPTALPGYSTPTDPMGWGFYEDVNGVNVFTIDDVILYFNQMQTIAKSEPICAFDVNGNGRIDFADVVKLYQKGVF